ncbi:MAG TPA: hypothetical protein VF635_15600 [Propionibacteriaceae bacterium]|jgi:pimeloyl-ACP methyl ester carboxylesterase
MAAIRVVLLPGAKDDPGYWSAVERALPRRTKALTLFWPALSAGSKAFSLQQGAEAAASAMQASGVTTATICGVGVGALVALQLAADHPDRVQSLVLATRQVGLSPILLSLPAAALRLLPARTVQRLGAGPEQVLALLDQARPVDFSALAARVHCPTVVLCGARDRLNRRGSATLARTLPHGQLELIPRAGAEWLSERPELLAEALSSSGSPT